MVVMTMVLLMFISGALALLLTRYSHAGFALAWPALGDFVLPLCLVLLAQIFRNRVCAVIAVALAFVNCLLRIIALIIRRETFMPLEFDSIALLWEHADHVGLSAVFGKYYYFWLLPIAVVIIAGIFYLCIRVWYATRKKRRVIPDSWITVFAVLFVISIISSILYIRQRKMEHENFASGLVRPVPVIMADMAGDIVSRTLGEQAECGFFPEELPADSAAGLEEKALFFRKPQGSEAKREESLFDRIIIIAVESLDYAMIGVNNPALPENLTPNLDRLIRENVSFSNFYTAAQPTSWGLTALVMSRLDYRRELKNPGNPSLFTIAGRNGYESFYFSPVSGFFGRNRDNFMKLFGGEMDNYFFGEEWKMQFNARGKYAWGMSDAEMFDLILKIFKNDNMPKRFVSLISTIDIHPPYTVVREKGCRKQFKSRFLDSIHCFDHHLGTFLNRIMSDSELYNERTLIVITSDHSATHGSNFLKRKDFNPDRIPLVLISPNKNAFAGLNTGKYCSTIDLTPTLVRWLGGRIPRTFMGRDLREEKNCAVSRTPADVLIIRNPENRSGIHVDINKTDTDPEYQLYKDYFRLYYSK